MKITNQYICRLLMLPLAVSVLAGCSDDPGMGVASMGNCLIKAEIAAPADADGGARTAVDPTNYESEQIGIHWVGTDTIGVYGPTTKNAIFTNLTQANSASTTFTGNLAEGEVPQYAYFPYHTGAGKDHGALQGTLASVQKYDSNHRTLDNDWKVGTPVSGSTNSFKFEHLFGFIRFHVSDSGSKLLGQKVESIQISLPGFTLNGKFTCAPVSGLKGKEMELVITTNGYVAKGSVTLKGDEIRKGHYHTLPLDLNSLKLELAQREGVEREHAPWYSGAIGSGILAEYCANTVFSLPNTPFMHKIRVPEGYKVVEVYGLPEGLEWDEKRQLVKGQVATELNEHIYSVVMENSKGATYSEGVKLTVSSNLAQPTPMMGWQSWNVLMKNISHDALVEQAQQLKNLGFLDAGYKYLGVDDFWSKDATSRDKGTNYPTVNSSKFPYGMLEFTSAIKSVDPRFKVGIYSDCGTVTCGKGNTGSLNYEEVDAMAFTEWGFEMLKEDWYNDSQDPDANKEYNWESTASALELYGRMGTAIKNNGNKMLLYMCEWGVHEPWKWAAETGASCWRATYDGRDGWNGAGNTGVSYNKVNGIGLRNTIDLMRNLWPWAGVNRFNDADMICVGIHGTGTPSSDCVDGKAGLTNDESVTAFVMWCMWSSPILLGMNMTNTKNFQDDMALLLNKDLIAINQDPMGQAAEHIKLVDPDKNGKGVDYYMKDLADGSVAIAVVNLTDGKADYSIDIKDYDALDPEATYTVYDLVNQKDSGYLSSWDYPKGTLNAHACVAFKITQAKKK